MSKHLSMTFIIMVIASLLGCQKTYSGKKPPKAVQGVVDLRNWDFDKDGPLDLNGEWEFQWDTLINPETKTPRLNQYMHLPGLWGKPGYGSFRVKFKLNNNQNFGIKIKERRASFEIFFNGEKITSNGVIGDNPRDNQGGIISEIYKVNTKNDVNEIVIYASNYNFGRGGIKAAPRLGFFEDLTREKEGNLLRDFFVIGGIFIMCLYHFILFALRPNEKSTLYCALFCFSAVIGALAEGEYYIMNIFPDLHYQNYWKIRLCFLFLTTAPLILFFKSIFTNYINSKIVKYWNIFSIASVLYVLALEFKLFLKLFLITYLPALALILIYALIQIIRSRKDYPQESRIIAIGMVIWIAAAVNDNLSAMFVINTPFVASYGLFLFIFSLSILLSIRFSSAFQNLAIAQIEVKELNTGLEAKVKEKTADIRSILIHIKQGIFALAGKGEPVIQEDYSSHLETILETEKIVGETIEKLLLEQSDLNPDERNIIEETIKFSMIGDSLTYDLNEHNLPNELGFHHRKNKAKILELDWGPIANPEDEIEKVLVCIRDVSLQRKLLSESEAQRQELNIIDEILKIKATKFNDFIDTSKKFIDENRRLIEENSEYSENALKTLFINMHTIKGNARTYHFQLMTGTIHEAEQAYSLLQKKEIEWNQQNLLSDLDSVSSIFDEYIRINETKLGRKTGDSKEVKKIESNLVKSVIDTINAIRCNGTQDSNLDEISNIRYQLQKIYYYPINDVFGEITNAVANLAKDLQKENPKVEIEKTNILLTKDAVKIFNDVFVHILRNSLDHGIESAEERKKAGKLPAGTISLSFKQSNGQLWVNYRDDGRGLNLKLLKEKSIEQGLSNSNSELDAGKIAELIFESGLSTAQKVSDISGRGVGMDAVRNYLMNNGGQINVELTGNERQNGCAPFAFRIALPSTFCINS